VRIQAIKGRGFLSFEDMVFDGLDHSLNVVVGPNGAGKSNLVRALELVGAALDWADVTASPDQETLPPLEQYARARHLHSTERGFEVRVKIELEGQERELMLAFVRVLFISTLSVQMESRRLRLEPTEPDRELPRQLDELAVAQLDMAAVSPLMTGEVVVARGGLPGAEFWAVGYEFVFDGDTYCWYLRGPVSDTIAVGRLIARESSSVRSLGNVFERAWPTGGPPIARIALSFDMLLPDTDLGGVVARTEPIGPQIYTRTASELLQSLGRLTPQNQWLTLAAVLRQIYRARLMVVPDQRPAPKTVYSASEIGARRPMFEIEAIPLELQRLKNGTASERSRYDAVQQRFESLTGRSVDIRMDHPWSAGSSGEVDVRQIEPQVSEEDTEVPLSFAGTGLWEGLLLAYVTTAPDGTVLVLDEPARNVHPNLQRKLLTQLLQRSGQSLLVSHSPYLVPARRSVDLHRTTRVHKRNGSSHILRLDSSGPQSSSDSEQRAQLWKELLVSTDARALLFAGGVVLCEGGTEAGVLEVWLGEAIEPTPDELNLVFFDVGGDQRFGFYSRYVDAYAIPWAIVCDGAVLNPNRPNSLRGQLKIDVPESELPGASDFEHWRSFWNERGVYTLADSFDQETEHFCEQLDERAWQQALQAEGTNKIRRGRAFAGLVQRPEVVERIYRAMIARLFGP